MEVDCRECAGCCIDWRSIAPDGVELDHERRGAFVPIDGTYNLVPLSGDEIRRFIREGLGDALTPRLFVADDDERSVRIGGRRLAALDDRPVFLIGLRKPPKPVAPFGTEPRWLPSCVFLDPTTLQCRIHGSETFPDACRTYPADNLALGTDTECERVEAAFGGERLLDRDPDGATPRFGPGALGGTVFVHPEPSRIRDSVEQIAAGELTADDRAEFAAIAAATSPGTLDVDDTRYDRARQRILGTSSWVGAAIELWEARLEETPDPSLAVDVEESRGASPTDGWD